MGIGANLTAKATLKRRDNYQTIIGSKDDSITDGMGDENAQSAISQGRSAIEVLIDS